MIGLRPGTKPTNPSLVHNAPVDRDGLEPEAGLWRIRLLGGLQASSEGRVVDRFPTRQTAALFAYLSLFPRPWSREVLGDLFWPDAEPESQRHSLRLALSRLRTLLGSRHPLQTNRLTVALDRTRFVTDVAEFEAAVARGDGGLAKRLYAGPLLPGHYDDWVIGEQVRLELLLEDVVEGPPAFPDTLPHGLGRLFGRHAEQAAIVALLQDHRVVTLTGPGGMGKTRLAAAIASAHGRAVWVPLSNLSEAARVADVVREVMRLPPPSPGFPIEDFVARELGELAPLLLVLDNAEQLLGEEFVRVLSRFLAVQNVSLLLTSRVTTGVDHEIDIPIGPLTESEGAALFEERARRARPGLSASPEAMLGLARRLGGIPLALELAAARAGVQGFAQIEAAAWANESDFGDAFGIPERHRSLNNVLTDSLALLPVQTRLAFSRLAVFRGGFDAAAAKAVASASLATLETLRRWALIVPHEEADGSLRFSMPEPLRDVAKEQANAAMEHARYFADWVEANRADELPPAPRVFGQRLALQERERDNVLTALDTCRRSVAPKARETGLRIVAAYWTHWYVRNAGEEMEGWAKSLLEGPGAQANPLIRAAAELSLALAVRERGAHEASAEVVDAALKTLLTGPRDRNAAFAWHLRGLTQNDLGHHAESEQAYLQAEALWLEIGDLRNYSVTRHNRAMLAAETGNLDAAETMVGEAMELFQAHCSTYAAVAHATVGSIRRLRGDLPGAASAMADAARLHRELGYVRGWAQNERDLALCLHGLGRDDEARSMANRSLSAFKRVGDRHGEATALSVLGRISGETWHFDEARGILSRHGLPAVGELLENL